MVNGKQTLRSHTKKAEREGGGQGGRKRQRQTKGERHKTGKLRRLNTECQCLNNHIRCAVFYTSKIENARKCDHKTIFFVGKNKMFNLIILVECDGGLTFGIHLLLFLKVKIESQFSTSVPFSLSLFNYKKSQRSFLQHISRIFCQFCSITWQTLTKRPIFGRGLRSSFMRITPSNIGFTFN